MSDPKGDCVRSGHSEISLPQTANADISLLLTPVGPIRHRPLRPQWLSDRLAFDDWVRAQMPLVKVERCAQRRLHDAVALLPKRERTLLYWRLSKHLKLRGIAAKLGITESRVSQLLGSTSKSLRLELAKDGADGFA